jgi:hypothetical protein
MDEILSFFYQKKITYQQLFTDEYLKFIVTLLKNGFLKLQLLKICLEHRNQSV